MKRNVGYTGRTVRIILGIVLGLVYFTGDRSGPVEIVALLAGIILIITGLAGFCPFNRLFGVNTCQRHLKEPRNPY